MKQSPGNEESEDIKFKNPEILKGFKYGQGTGEPKDKSVTSRCGVTRQVEVPNEESGHEHVCLLWNHVPEEITLDAGGGAAKSAYKFIMTVDRDSLVAEQEMKSGKL